MTEPSPALRRLEVRLRAAVETFAFRLRQEHAPIGAEPAFVLARLAPELSAEERGDPTRLAAPRRLAIARRLGAENDRLARLARAADPRYDLNRHIALRRLLAILGAEGSPIRASRHGKRRRPARRAADLAPQPAA